MVTGIKKRGGRYVIRFDGPPDPLTGRRKQKSRSGGKTLHEAQRRLRKALSDVDNNTYVDPSSMTLANYLEQWMRDYCAIKVAETTIEGYWAIIKSHLGPKLGHIRLSSLTPAHIQQYYAELLRNGRVRGSGGLSAQTVRHHHTLLHSALSRAVRLDILSQNPADRVDAPRVPRRESSVLDVEGVGRVLSVAKGYTMYPLVAMAIYSGMNRSELLGLRWRELDLERGSVSVVRAMHQIDNKGRVFREPKAAARVRLLPLSATPIGILREHRDEQARAADRVGIEFGLDSLVFATAAGAARNPDTVTHTVKKILVQAGYPEISLHMLRHTMASLMLLNGEPSKVVSERLGHSDIGITMNIYSHVMPGMQEAAMQRLEEVLNA